MDRSVPCRRTPTRSRCRSLPRKQEVLMALLYNHHRLLHTRRHSCKLISRIAVSTLWLPMRDFWKVPALVLYTFAGLIFVATQVLSGNLAYVSTDARNDLVIVHVRWKFVALAPDWGTAQ